MATRRQPEVGADRPGAPEAGRIIDRGTEGQGIDRSDPRHGHETTGLIMTSGKGKQLASETRDLLAPRPPVEIADEGRGFDQLRRHANPLAATTDAAFQHVLDALQL